MRWVGFDSGVWLLVVMVSRWLGLVCFCLDDCFLVFVLCCWSWCLFCAVLLAICGCCGGLGFDLIGWWVFDDLVNLVCRLAFCGWVFVDLVFCGLWFTCWIAV